MKQVTAKVINIEQILKELERTHGRNILGSRIIWLRCPEIAAEARPGQFVMVKCGGKECVLPRPISIHQVNDKGDMALFFAVWEDGKGTKWLSQRQVGDNIDLFGPLGNGYTIYPDSKKLLLVAGGIGVAPLRFLADQAQHSYSVKLLSGASGEFQPSGEPNPGQLYPKDRLPPGIQLKTITSSPDGQTGMVTDLLTPDVVNWADQVFACGPIPMYRDMARKKQGFRLDGKPVQISLEMRMGCGLGVCYGCTVKTKNGLKQVCQDGPVFDLEDILWDEPLLATGGKLW